MMIRQHTGHLTTRLVGGDEVCPEETCGVQRRYVGVRWTHAVLTKTLIRCVSVQVASQAITLLL